MYVMHTRKGMWLGVEGIARGSERLWVQILLQAAAMFSLQVNLQSHCKNDDDDDDDDDDDL